MSFCFATCRRDMALGFMRKMYPNCTINDEGKTAELLDEVQADNLRVQDPDYHPRAQIIVGTNKEGDTEYRDYMYALCVDWHSEVMSTKTD